MIQRPPAVFALAFCLAVTPASGADAPRKLGTFGDWTAYSYREDGHPVCYMMSRPLLPTGFAGRDDTYIMITHRPDENSFGVLHLAAGYVYPPASEVALRIDTKKFSLFTDQDSAWAHDHSTERAIAKAMRATRGTMITLGPPPALNQPSESTPPVSDIYSLRGVTVAWKTIGKACGAGENLD